MQNKTKNFRIKNKNDMFYRLKMVRFKFIYYNHPFVQFIINVYLFYVSMENGKSKNEWF